MEMTVSRREEKCEKFIDRMWKVVPRDVELPPEVTLSSHDFFRLCEGYANWMRSLNDPEMAKAKALILKVSKRIEEDQKDSPPQ